MFLSLEVPKEGYSTHFGAPSDYDDTPILQKAALYLSTVAFFAVSTVLPIWTGILPKKLGVHGNFLSTTIIL